MKTIPYHTIQDELGQVVVSSITHIQPYKGGTVIYLVSGGFIQARETMQQITDRINSAGTSGEVGSTRINGVISE